MFYHGGGEFWAMCRVMYLPCMVVCMYRYVDFWSHLTLVSCSDFWPTPIGTSTSNYLSHFHKSLFNKCTIRSFPVNMFSHLSYGLLKLRDKLALIKCMPHLSDLVFFSAIHQAVFPHKSLVKNVGVCDLHTIWQNVKKCYEYFCKILLFFPHLFQNVFVWTALVFLRSIVGSCNNALSRVV